MELWKEYWCATNKWKHMFDGIQEAHHTKDVGSLYNSICHYGDFDDHGVFVSWLFFVYPVCGLQF
jgi:hypothetical protein